MPVRKHTPDFTACTQFGLRYSTLGKRIAASEPYHDGESPREVTSTMNLYELCEALDIELTEEQAEKEAEYIYENRRQFYKNHPYMEKRAIAQCYDGPVFPDDVVYRRSNCEKYTVRKDGSIINTSGTVEVKTPNWEGFVHTAPKKHEKVATFTKGMPRKTNDKSPAITLPKQDNPLVKGEYKTRTPEEESRAKAKQREAIRKEVAKTTEEEKQTVREHYLAEITDKDLFEELRRRDTEPLDCFTNEELYKEIDRRGIVVHLTLEKASAMELIEELNRRGCDKTFTKTLENAIVKGHYGPEAVAEILPDLDDVDFVNIFREEDRRRFGDRREPFFSLITNQELAEEVNRRGIFFADAPVAPQLQPTTDKDLVEELRRRGYEVTATKTINL